MATVDEQQRGRVQDDLNGFIKGEILFDDLSRAMYSSDASIFQLERLCLFEERNVTRVRTRPATFNEIHAKRIEVLSDATFVVNRKIHTFALHSIAKGRVVDFNSIAHFALP